MATLMPLKLDDTGLQPSTSAADTGGDEFSNPNDQRTFLYVDNQDTGSKQVTITAQKTERRVGGFGVMTKSDIVVNVPGGEVRMIGPFPPEAYNDNTGKVQVSYDDVTSLKVAAVHMPAPALS